MEQTLVLSESQIHAIIKESFKKILLEYDTYQHMTEIFLRDVKESNFATIDTVYDVQFKEDVYNLQGENDNNNDYPFAIINALITFDNGHCYVLEVSYDEDGIITLIEGHYSKGHAEVPIQRIKDSAVLAQCQNLFGNELYEYVEDEY